MDSIIDFFDAFPSQEFDQKSIEAQCYASKDAVAKNLRALVAAKSLTYRLTESGRTVKRVYRRS